MLFEQRGTISRQYSKSFMKKSFVIQWNVAKVNVPHCHGNRVTIRKPLNILHATDRPTECLQPNIILERNKKTAKIIISKFQQINSRLMASIDGVLLFIYGAMKTKRMLVDQTHENNDSLHKQMPLLTPRPFRLTKIRD